MKVSFQVFPWKSREQGTVAVTGMIGDSWGPNSKSYFSVVYSKNHGRIPILAEPNCVTPNKSVNFTTTIPKNSCVFRSQTNWWTWIWKYFTKIWQRVRCQVKCICQSKGNPKHKQTAQRRLLKINYVNKISNAFSVTTIFSSEFSQNSWNPIQLQESISVCFGFFFFFQLQTSRQCSKIFKLAFKQSTNQCKSAIVRPSNFAIRRHHLDHNLQTVWGSILTIFCHRWGYNLAGSGLNFHHFWSHLNLKYRQFRTWTYGSSFAIILGSKFAIKCGYSYAVWASTFTID